MPLKRHFFFHAQYINQQNFKMFDETPFHTGNKPFFIAEAAQQQRLLVVHRQQQRGCQQ